MFCLNNLKFFELKKSPHFPGMPWLHPHAPITVSGTTIGRAACMVKKLKAQMQYGRQ